MDDTEEPVLHERGKALEKASHYEKRLRGALFPEMTNILWRNSTPQLDWPLCIWFAGCTPIQA